MKMLTVTMIAAFVICTGVVGAEVQPVTWTSGDLGNNVVYDAGGFSLFPELTNPSNVLPAELVVKYGLWNSPDVLVDVFFNDVVVGNLLADDGYISPGAEFASYEVTGLLQKGENTILFTGHGANDGDYVVGQVDLHYNIPEPMTVFLLGLGSLALLRKRGTQEKDKVGRSELKSRA